MIEQEKIEKIFEVLGNKAERIAIESGYTDEEVGSPEYLKFERAWEEYLGKIGVERVGRHDKVYVLDERLWVPDPLYTTGEWILMGLDTAERILMLGLP